MNSLHSLQSNSSFTPTTFPFYSFWSFSILCHRFCYQKRKVRRKRKLKQLSLRTLESSAIRLNPSVDIPTKLSLIFFTVYLPIWKKSYSKNFGQMFRVTLLMGNLLGMADIDWSSRSRSKSCAERVFLNDDLILVVFIWTKDYGYGKKEWWWLISWSGWTVIMMTQTLVQFEGFNQQLWAWLVSQTDWEWLQPTLLLYSEYQDMRSFPKPSFWSYSALRILSLSSIPLKVLFYLQILFFSWNSEGWYKSRHLSTDFIHPVFQSSFLPQVLITFIHIFWKRCSKKIPCVII